MGRFSVWQEVRLSFNVLCSCAFTRGRAFGLVSAPSSCPACSAEHHHLPLCSQAHCTAHAALNILVENKITGMPVVDEAGKVVGVVSDYDMLTLDNISGRMEQTGIFPTASMDWEAFHEVQKLILKNVGKM